MKQWSFYLSLQRNGPVKDPVHSQDGRLWGVDDRCAQEWTEHSAVADGESTAIHVFNRYLTYEKIQAATSFSQWPYLAYM